MSCHVELYNYCYPKEFVSFLVFIMLFVIKKSKDDEEEERREDT